MRTPPPLHSPCAVGRRDARTPPCSLTPPPLYSPYAGHASSPPCSPAALTPPPLHSPCAGRREDATVFTCCPYALYGSLQLQSDCTGPSVHPASEGLHLLQTQEAKTNKTHMPMLLDLRSMSVPAWPVSVLPDCKTVAYNTSKIKVQTSVIVKKPNTVEQEPESLKWSWMPGNLRPFMTDELLEQIATSTDQFKL